MFARFLPRPTAPVDRIGHSRSAGPFAPPPPQTSSGLTATTGRSASERHDWYSVPSVLCLGTLPLATFRACDPGRRIDARLLTFRARAADQAHAAFTPGTTWPVIGTPARLHRGRTARSPAFDADLRLCSRRLNSARPPGLPGRTLLERLPGPHLTRSSAPSPDRSPRRSSANAASGWFGASPRRATPEGQQASISSTAPPMKDAAYMASSSAFVTHGCCVKGVKNLRNLRGGSRIAIRGSSEGLVPFALRFEATLNMGRPITDRRTGSDGWFVRQPQAKARARPAARQPSWRRSDAWNSIAEVGAADFPPKQECRR